MERKAELLLYALSLPSTFRDIFVAILTCNYDRADELISELSDPDEDWPIWVSVYINTTDTSTGAHNPTEGAKVAIELFGPEVL
jgi:hypothetical protein